MDKTLISLLMSQSELIGSLRTEIMHITIETPGANEIHLLQEAVNGILSARHLTLKKLGCMDEEDTTSTRTSSTNSNK